MYNAYIPGCEPYEKIPEETTPGSEQVKKNTPKEKGVLGGLRCLLQKLGMCKLQSRDLLLLLILFLLLREGDKFDSVLLLALAAIFLLPDGIAGVEDGPIG